AIRRRCPRAFGNCRRSDRPLPPTNRPWPASRHSSRRHGRFLFLGWPFGAATVRERAPALEIRAATVRERAPAPFCQRRGRKGAGARSLTVAALTESNLPSTHGGAMFPILGLTIALAAPLEALRVETPSLDAGEVKIGPSLTR